VTDDWNVLAARFDDEPDHGLRDPVVRDAWWSLLEPELPPAPASVADLACGTGSLSLLLAERGYEVTGVDLAPAMLERASTKLGDRARFLLGDVTAPPLRDGGFDVVLARHILFALDDPAAAIARWTRLLAPAGRLLLIEGFWHAGAGMRAEEVERIVRTSRAEAVVTRLDEAPDLWGGPVADERFLVASRR
jgi:ubiquinone/menaquinone biosynthesis C-methylase UbiE